MTYDEATCHLNPYDADAVECVDASLFTGHSFTDGDRRRALRSIMRRWERRLCELDALEEV